MNRKLNNRGFTLIELMVVIVILGILAGLIVPRIMGRPEEARRAKAAMQMESMETALKLYKLDSGTYPSTEQGLQAWWKHPRWASLRGTGGKAGTWRRGKFRKTPGGMTMSICLREPTASTTSCPTVPTGNRAARTRTRI